jgi:hypothetical protein
MTWKETAVNALRRYSECAGVTGENYRSISKYIRSSIRDSKTELLEYKTRVLPTLTRNWMSKGFARRFAWNGGREDDIHRE